MREHATLEYTRGDWNIYRTIIFIASFFRLGQKLKNVTSKALINSCELAKYRMSDIMVLPMNES